MTKVLYISHFDGTGYGQAAVQNTLCMDSVGIDVVPRPFILNNTKPIFESRLKELANKSAEGCDTVIFHTLPHFIERGDFKKHIGLFATETDSFNDANWNLYLNNFCDEVWTINKESQLTCLNSGVDKPMRLFPHPCNPDKYKREYSKLPLPCSSDDVILLFAGEFARRKNVGSLIRAFHSEFSREEPVQLLLKVNKSGISTQELAKQVGDFCNEIKKGLKLYTNVTDYKPEMILTEYLTEEQIMSLYESTDIAVNASYGEAWNLPLFDAAALGNIVVSNDCGGPHDYLKDFGNGLLVKNRVEPCFGAIDSINNLYTARENWYNIDPLDLQNKMREAYNMVIKRKKEKDRVGGLQLAERYSYNNVGQKIREYLTD